MVDSSKVAVALVVVVLLAGCSGLGGDGSADGTPGGETVTPAGTPTPGAGETFEYPDGFGPEGVTDAETAVATHNAAVQERGSYDGEYAYVVESEEGVTDVDIAIRADFGSERAYERVDVEGPNGNATTETYYESEQVYARSEFDGEGGSPTVENQTFPSDEVTAVGAVEPLLQNASDYEATLEQRGGEEVVVYETTDAGNLQEFLEVDDPENVTDFRATFVLASDGVVESAEYDVTYIVDGEERRVTLTYELSGFGETTVDRPTWADDAEGS